MGKHLDRVPFSGIIRIRDMMFSVPNPFRLDQGDISFNAPDSVRNAMARAIEQNKTHYVQTTGIPDLLDLLTAKLRKKNRIAVESRDEVMVTNGGIHGLYVICQALLEPGDEVIVPDPEWPPCAANIISAQGVPIACPLHESIGWRYDIDELRSKIGPRTRAIYLNSPNNPTGGMVSREDLVAIARLAGENDLWILSDEAYKDVIFDDNEHVSIASLPDCYERTIPFYTFSKSYAMTGLRLGYFAIKNAQVRERAKKVLFYTTGNVSSVIQHGGIGALSESQESIEWCRQELQARRDLFYAGIEALGGDVLSGEKPAGAFYAFLRINPRWTPPASTRGTSSPSPSISWMMAEYLITQGRIGAIPGVDFGENGEGYIRFCFARERSELTGALESMNTLFGTGMRRRTAI